MNAHSRKKTADEKKIFEVGRKATEMMKSAEQVATLANARAKEALERVAQLDREAADARHQCHAALEAAKASEESNALATARVKVLFDLATEAMKIVGVENQTLSLLLPKLQALVAEEAQLRQEGTELATQCMLLDKELKEERARDITYKANSKLRLRIFKVTEERDAALAKLDQMLNPPKPPARLAGMAGLVQALNASDEKVKP